MLSKWLVLSFLVVHLLGSPHWLLYYAAVLSLSTHVAQKHHCSKWKWLKSRIVWKRHRIAAISLISRVFLLFFSSRPKYFQIKWEPVSLLDVQKYTLVGHPDLSAACPSDWVQRFSIADIDDTIAYLAAVSDGRISQLSMMYHNLSLFTILVIHAILVVTGLPCRNWE